MSTVTSTSPLPRTRCSRRCRVTPDIVAPQQVILALVLLFEIAIFGLLGENFLTADNLLHRPAARTSNWRCSPSP